MRYCVKSERDVDLFVHGSCIGRDPRGAEQRGQDGSSSSNEWSDKDM